ncbi:MAG: hypothetical protein HFI29_01850 [Lachnospiraceae bacterium]|nr:hypothetical protein [Lachnospiraceae bacterium]
MREQRKSRQKERNYSVWFTGGILVLVYMILMDQMSKTQECGCKSIAKEQVWQAAEAALDREQEE